MTASGFKVRVTGLVFVFLVFVPTCIRQPKTNTFDKLDGFIWFQVLLDGFRSF